MLRIRLCGGVAVEAGDHAVPSALLAGRQGRLVLAYLICSRGRPVPREELADVLWGDQVPESWPASLSAVVSRLRKMFNELGLDGQQALASIPSGYQLALPEDTWVDWWVAHVAIERAEKAVEARAADEAAAAAAEAASIVERGFLTDDCEWVDRQREAARDISLRAALAKAAAHLASGSPRRAIEEARDAVRRDPMREASYRLLMEALAAVGERAEALRMWEHCRTTLVEELGVDPSPETEAVYLEILGATTAPDPAPATAALPSGVVTFLLTDIVESSALWERHPDAMAVALERHDALVAEVVEAHGGTVLKSKLEGDATISVFARATAGAHAALALRDALEIEPWPDSAAPRVRMALHTGEAIERAGDYFGPALNRAARLRSLAGGSQILLSQAAAQLVVDHLPDGVKLADRGHRDLRGLSRGENVYELGVGGASESDDQTAAPLVRPALPSALLPTGPFVGRDDALTQVLGEWDKAAEGCPRAVLLAGEPGVGKSRLAAESARAVYERGAVVIYGHCDEELGAPLQPFIEAIRPLVPAVGAARLRAVQGIDELSRVIPQLADLLPEITPGSRADPDAERYALFDAITRLLATVSAETPVLVVLDDLHWAGKTTLTLLRHLLRNAEAARVLVVGTYRDTELARTHPLAATLADLHRDGTTERITLGGLDADDVTAYLQAVGRHDPALGRELARVTSGNPFFVIETVRHVEETGGSWDAGSLPQGVREATGRRLSRLSDATNDALSVAAVAGTTFSLELVESVRGAELLEEIDEARRAGLVAEDVGAPGRFRFAHALVRQVLLAELVTVKRVRLHRRIAELLEETAVLDDDTQLTDLAHHWFECASSGSADKAVAYCRRAADRAIDRLAYEEAADLYGMALQALEGLESDGVERAALLLARCDALLTAGDVMGARGAIDDLSRAADDSDRLQAWHAVYAAQLAVLAEPDRLTDVIESVGAAAAAMRDEGDLVGEAKAHYVHALALDRLGRIGASEKALDAALAAARKGGDRRLADAVLAGAPQAALWGPSTVTRASGRCLDVVRVLRITSGASAVEAVALRCQAVLEALRGRMDVSRQMIDSARRTVEELGLGLRVLETEVMAGLIELLDGDAVAAEARLRPAYEALRAGGLGGEAALAGALLGRALLEQDRDAEAEGVADEAAELAGSDLKAAIAWRGVLAEAAARRGDTERALELARAAVELATATDALLLVADARRSLASVLRITGDTAAAAAEGRRTAEACDAKGATVLAERARAVLTEAPEPTVAEAEAAHPPSRAIADVSNAAVRHFERFNEAWTARDWAGVDALVAPTWRIRDRRTNSSGDLSPEDSRTSMRILFDGNRTNWVVEEIIATRGDRLALARRRVDVIESGERVAELRSLSLWQVDEESRRDVSVDFEEDDLDAAFEELDRLYTDGEASAAPDAWRTMLDYATAINAGDDTAMRRLYAPGFGSLGSLALTPADSDLAIDHLLGLTRLHPGTQFRFVHVMALEESRALAVARGGAADEFELEGVSVYAFDEQGRFRDRWGFRVEQLDEAWARYHALGIVDAPIGERFPNAATRLAKAIDAGWAARDLDACLALIGDAEVIDRRLDADSDLEGRGSFIRGATAAFEGGLETERRSTTIATRGDGLALVRVEHSSASDEADTSDIESLELHEVDEDDRATRAVFFDLGDLDAAYDELDRMYFEGEGAVGRGLRERFDAIKSALEADDDPGAAEWFAPGFRFVNHRALGWDDLDAAGFVAHAKQLYALREDATVRIRHVLAADERRSMVVHSLEDRNAAGDFELLHVAVSEADADGRAIRRDVYDVDQLDEAWARYHEIGAAPVPVGERFANAATRSAKSSAEAWNARDFDAYRAHLAADFREVDTREVIGGERDLAEHVSLMRPAFDSKGQITLAVSTVATRGDRLALVVGRFEGTWGASGSTVIATYAVYALDDDGHLLRLVIFDAEDLDRAYDELDRLFAEGEGARGGPIWGRAGALVQGLHSQDADAMADALAPGFRFVSHGLLGRGELDGLEFIDHISGIFAVRPDAKIRIRHVLAIGSGRMLSVGTNGDSDAGYEIAFVNASQYDATGRLVRRDSFDLDQLDDAWARYHEIGAIQVDAQEPREATLVERAIEAWDHAYDAADWKALRDLCADDMVCDDRRPIVGSPVAGAELFVENHKVVHSMGGRRRREPVSRCGTRLATLLEHWNSGLELVSLVEVDGEGRMAAAIMFDAEQWREAERELHRRFRLGEAASHADVVDAIYRFREAFEDRAPDALRATLTPDLRVVDHRAVALPVIEDADAYVAAAEQVWRLAPEMRLAGEWLALGDQACVLRPRRWGRLPDGGEIHDTFVMVMSVRDGRVDRIEAFDDSGTEAALATFRELDGDSEDAES